MGTVKRAWQLRESTAVERLHTCRHREGYNNGFHVNGMLQLLDLLYPTYPPYNLVRAILWHDVHELWLGDMPAPAKRLDPELGTAYAAAAELVEDELDLRVLVTSAESKWLHALDALEFYMFTLDEAHGGNQHIRHCKNRIEDALGKMDLPDEVEKFFDDLKREGWQRTDERI